jgi:hypothetical protein
VRWPRHVVVCGTEPLGCCLFYSVSGGSAVGVRVMGRARLAPQSCSVLDEVARDSPFANQRLSPRRS